MYDKKLTTRMRIRQLGIVFLTIGGVLFLNKISFSTITIVIGAFFFMVYYFIRSFDHVKKETDWETVFPELALGVSDELEEDVEIDVNANKYRIQRQLFYRIYHISLSVLIGSLSIKLFLWSNNLVNFSGLNNVLSILFMLSDLILVAAHFISIFEPIKHKYDWSKVYPELKIKNTNN